MSRSRTAAHPACQGRLGRTISSYPDHREMKRFSGAFRPTTASSVRRSLGCRLVFQDRHGIRVSPNLRETTNDVCRGHRGNFCVTALDSRPATSATVVLRHHRHHPSYVYPGLVESRACLHRWTASRPPSARCRQPGCVALRRVRKQLTEQHRQRRVQQRIC